MSCVSKRARTPVETHRVSSVLYTLDISRSFHSRNIFSHANNASKLKKNVNTLSLILGSSVVFIGHLVCWWGIGSCGARVRILAMLEEENFCLFYSKSLPYIYICRKGNSSFNISTSMIYLQNTGIKLLLLILSLSLLLQCAPDISRSFSAYNSRTMSFVRANLTKVSSFLLLYKFWPKLINWSGTADDR